MACVGRTKECTIVPSNHYGPIPGIPVGTMWRFRVQVPAGGPRRPGAPPPGAASPRLSRWRPCCRGGGSRDGRAAFGGRVGPLAVRAAAGRAGQAPLPQVVPLVPRWLPQVSESGVHRPHVAGIHGRSNDGAYSLVLAGGYEDDVVSGGAGIYFVIVGKHA